MTKELQNSVCNQLVAQGHADKTWALVILAALDGDSSLNGYLDGVATVTVPTAAKSTKSAVAQSDPPGVFVSSISVSGFRGIGATASLKLNAGPGLTLVVGRNGSGKSSFAEALECLFTGTSYRWEGRHAPWKTGWRNLHEPGKVALKADLVVEGQGPLAISRVWQGDALTDAETIVSAKGKKDRPLSALGWDATLATFRPFLSYNELGSLLDDGPSKLFDALSSVLGLEELTAVQNLLATARKSREQLVAASKNGAKDIAQRTASVESNDDRFSKALRALTSKTPDLAALENLVVSDDAPEASVVSRLREIAALKTVSPDAVVAIVERLRAAERESTRVAGTNAQRARQRADLLETAVSVQAVAESTDCPVCKAKARLSSAWLRATQMEIAALRDEARSFDAAESSRRAAMAEAQRVIVQPPPVLAQSTMLGLASLAEARTIWAAWSTGRDLTSAAALADHLDTHTSRWCEAVVALTTEANDEARKRDDTWRPMALAIAAWLRTAKQAQKAQSAIADLKDAEAWWKDTSERMRNERFAPIAQRAMHVWKQLRLQSNVDLGDVGLTGTGVKRKVALQVTVDGTPAEAVGVMSQGELHALALSLFLPRATLPESPFRFIAIDDPVQSMDPARVDGLARVLADAAKTRQVLVFTHDDRLADATRRLGIPASVLSVTRREKSAVDVRQTQDPVTAYLDDARAVAMTDELPNAVIRRVVPGFCRSAIEAACMEKVRSRRLHGGRDHEEVEALLAANGKTHPLMSLALFDDETRTGEVLGRLNKMGAWAASVFKDCKEGAHAAYPGDLTVLVDDTKRLAAEVRKLS